MTSGAPPSWEDDPIPFAVSATPGGDPPRVTASGELDLHGSGRLLDAVRGAARAGEALTVDLRALTFLDSTGARTLLRADRVAREAGARRVRFLVAPAGAVGRVMELTGLRGLIEIEGAGAR